MTLILFVDMDSFLRYQLPLLVSSLDMDISDNKLWRNGYSKLSHRFERCSLRIAHKCQTDYCPLELPHSNVLVEFSFLLTTPSFSPVILYYTVIN